MDIGASDFDGLWVRLRGVAQLGVRVVLSYIRIECQNEGV